MNRGDRGVGRVKCLGQVILPRISYWRSFSVGQAWRVIIGLSCVYTMDIADHVYYMEIQVCVCVCVCVLVL